MRIAFIGALAVLGLASAARAQPGTVGPPTRYPPSPFAGLPTINPANVMPNIYNPRTQPLSPYLNLFGNNNPGVNYYYGVRPGTIGGAGSFHGAPSVTASGASRPAFFPQLGSAPDPFDSPLAGTGAPLSGEGNGFVLPPAGHPVVFGNTLGFFPGPADGGQNVRPGLSGIGNTRPAGRK
jgi:hypothetical protein